MDHEINDMSQRHQSRTQQPQQQADTTLVMGYALCEKLGSGSFATVYKGIRRSDGTAALNAPATTAIKCISLHSKKLTPKVLSNLQIEISILRTHSHPNIVRLYDVSTTDTDIYLILEFCGGGDLQALLRKKKRLEERVCRRMLRDLTCGLEFLWRRDLVHRDIKPQNLLLSEAWVDEEPSGGTGWSLKIADFGFARYLGGVDLAETMCGSPLYMAPEILLGQKYDAKADLWSVGTVLFEMISGRTPFHGENHMDLLHNMKRKAVRLPSDVRVSKECVYLLRILLDRKPASRADFRTFFKAVESFVALGCDICGGMRMMEGESRDGGDRLGMVPLKAQMDLCAITEDEVGELDGVGSSEAMKSHGVIMDGGGGVVEMRTAVVTTIQQVPLTDMGVVTPPLNPVPAPAPPPALHAGLQGGMRVGGSRPSVFAPLQGSPNISPSVTPVTSSFPTLSLLDGGTAVMTNLRNLSSRPEQDRFAPSVPNEYHQKSLQPKERNNQSTRFSQDVFDSGFVLVEHSGQGSRSNSSTNNSPSNSITRAPPSPSMKFYQDRLSRSPSPKHSSSRVIVTSTTGMLGTSPATGQALFGKMLMDTSQAKSGLSIAPVSSGKFNILPQSSVTNGGCLAHIESLARILAAAEDVGRRAISVAHLGDVRAYLAMGILIAQQEDSRSSSSSCTPMDGIDEDGNCTISVRTSIRGTISKKPIVEEDEEDELPFAMTTSMDEGATDDMSQSPAGNIMSNLAPIFGNINKAENSSNKDKEDNNTAIVYVRFREALLCYVKTLSMMKGSICAAQNVLSDIAEVLRLPSGRPSPNNNNPYAPLHKRCSGSLDWLKGQFSAVLDRANAASEQISILEKVTLVSQLAVTNAVVSVEELIYNHSLKCGREGAVKQILGHYDAARSCFRSAGLLAETLLMDPKVGDEDRVILEGYVHSFADQIMELDGLIQSHQHA